MKEMSASEASRNFSAVLDAVEDGETVIVTRAGRRVALISSAPVASGTEFNAVVARWHGTSALDDAFAAHIARARSAASVDEDTDSWTG